MARLKQACLPIVWDAIEMLREHLRDLGEQLGTDATALRTWARGKKKPSEIADPEADWGYKIRRWRDKKGNVRGKANVGLQLDPGILVMYGLALGHLKRGARHWRSYTRVAD